MSRKGERGRKNGPGRARRELNKARKQPKDEKPVKSSNMRDRLENVKKAYRKIWTRIVEFFNLISYRIIESGIQGNETYQRWELRLVQADLRMTPPLYLLTICLIGFLSTMIGLIVYMIIFYSVLNPPNAWIYVLLLSAMTSTAGFMAFPILLMARISARRKAIDKELPFTLSELSILASTGISPINIFRRISQRDVNPAMSQEFKKVIYKVDVEGRDIISALGLAAKETPSQYLRETFWDLSNMVHEGGSLNEYLKGKADQGLNIKRAVQRDFIGTLDGIMQMYMTVVIVGTLLMGIGAYVMDAMGNSGGMITGEDLLSILAYGFVPLVMIVIIILVMLAHRRVE